MLYIISVPIDVIVINTCIEYVADLVRKQSVLCLHLDQMPCLVDVAPYGSGLQAISLWSGAVTGGHIDTWQPLFQ